MNKLPIGATFDRHMDPIGQARKIEPSPLGLTRDGFTYIRNHQGRT